MSDTRAIIEIPFHLAELPSSQHRAGLAGLVLVVRELQRDPDLEGVCEIYDLEHTGATLRIDRQGLREMFDEVYAAAIEEQPRPRPYKDRNKNVVPPLRVETRTTTHPKTGKQIEKTWYIYPQVVPRGSFLADIDRASGQGGVWIKLWRDVLWSIFRGIHLQRIPYKRRADGQPTSDADKAWADLVERPLASVDLPSTYYIGAQAATAENVPFRDRARMRFLLHFWPFVASIYCPTVVDNKGESKFSGFALAIPDITDLVTFCEEYADVLRARGSELLGYRPREAVVDLAIESGLDTMRRLGERVMLREGGMTTSDLLLGIDVVHVAKQGNNVRMLGTARVEPDPRRDDAYARIREAYWDRIFRRQRLLNLVEARPWWFGFEGLFRTVSWKRTIDSRYFSRDAHRAFQMEANVNDDTPANAPKPLEKLVYQVVGAYLVQRLEGKYRLRWEEAKKSDSTKKKYEESKRKVARDAFLAIRARSGRDFVDYFGGTLFSYPQHLGEQGYLTLTRALLEDPDIVRTLTMLALSARS